MSIDAVMWFRFDGKMADDEIAAVNVEAARSFPSTFCFPSLAPIERDHWSEAPSGGICLTSDLYFDPPIEKPKGGHWYCVRVPDRYCFPWVPHCSQYGVDARGAEGAMAHCDLADWIERRIPGAEVWYGNDQEGRLRRWDEYARRIRRAYLYLSNCLPESYDEALPIMTVAKESARTHPERARWLLELHAELQTGHLADALRRLAAQICPRCRDSQPAGQAADPATRGGMTR